MKKHMKRSVAAIVCCISGLSVAEGLLPKVSAVDMVQPQTTRRVTIGYTLENAPAVVTLDIQTNVTGDVWASIGGEHIQRVSPDSAVFRKITENGRHTIDWRPDIDWPDHAVTDGKCRAVVKAWSLNNTPDYLVCDISQAAEADAARYYPSVDFLPGGLLKNPEYRTSKLVLRKIMAKNVTYTMGSINESGRNSVTEGTHTVTLTNNFYMAVFETTQAQYQLVMRRISSLASDSSVYAPSAFSYAPDSAMRPVDSVSMDRIRWWGNANFWPNPPHQSTFLSSLRTITGINDFDLPCEAQWEYACRAGHGENKWGDGSAYTDKTTCEGLPGRYASNGGTYSGAESAQTADSGTAIVGTYPPNSWGLYDMHGNVQEFCNDWYLPDILDYGGRPNVSLSDPYCDLEGTKREGTTLKRVVLRGGYFLDSATDCRSAHRADSGCVATYEYKQNGFRVICQAGLD